MKKENIANATELIKIRERILVLSEKIENNSYLAINGELFTERGDSILNNSQEITICKELKSFLIGKISGIINTIDKKLEELD